MPLRFPMQTASSSGRPGGGTAPAARVFVHRVLLVEDQPDVAQATVMGLELLGAEVVVAATGNEALRQAPLTRPTLVLLDIDLPDISGHEVGRRLRTMPELDSAVLVALTSWDTSELRQRSTDAGLAEHLVKPLDLDALDRLLQRTAPPRQP
jgi:CheY-like chemotaxis protein